MRRELEWSLSLWPQGGAPGPLSCKRAGKGCGWTSESAKVGLLCFSAQHLPIGHYLLGLCSGPSSLTQVPVCLLKLSRAPGSVSPVYRIPPSPLCAVASWVGMGKARGHSLMFSILMPSAGCSGLDYQAVLIDPYLGHAGSSQSQSSSHEPGGLESLRSSRLPRLPEA